jgi:hypothetical protein
MSVLPAPTGSASSSLSSLLPQTKKPRRVVQPLIKPAVAAAEDSDEEEEKFLNTAPANSSLLSFVSPRYRNHPQDLEIIFMCAAWLVLTMPLSHERVFVSAQLPAPKSQPKPQEQATASTVSGKKMSHAQMTYDSNRSYLDCDNAAWSKC